MIPDAVEIAKEKSSARKRKEITMLERLISAKQDQLKKIKTEVAIELSGKLCDEEDHLFTLVSEEEMKDTTLQILNPMASETNTNPQECVENNEDKFL